MPSNNFPGIGPIKYGFSHNYFNKVAVNWTTFGGGSTDGYQPDMIINLPEPTSTVIFTNLTATSSTDGYASGTVIEYSFDGTTVHGELGSNTNNFSLTFQDRVISLIWFRVQSGSSGTLNVSVQAWGVR
ncbi:MAG TPA: hypothetical protein VII94_05930 [Candidatus Saccharimonadales bacterium]